MSDRSISMDAQVRNECQRSFENGALSYACGESSVEAQPIVRKGMEPPGRHSEVGQEQCEQLFMTGRIMRRTSGCCFCEGRVRFQNGSCDAGVS